MPAQERTEQRCNGIKSAENITSTSTSPGKVEQGATEQEELQGVKLNWSGRNMGPREDGSGGSVNHLLGPFFDVFRSFAFASFLHLARQTPAPVSLPL